VISDHNSIRRRSLRDRWGNSTLVSPVGAPQSSDSVERAIESRYLTLFDKSPAGNMIVTVDGVPGRDSA
jgi:hypothetical protein